MNNLSKVLIINIWKTIELLGIIVLNLHVNKSRLTTLCELKKNNNFIESQESSCI